MGRQCLLRSEVPLAAAASAAAATAGGCRGDRPSAPVYIAAAETYLSEDGFRRDFSVNILPVALKYRIFGCTVALMK